MSKNVQTVIRDFLKRLPFGDKLVDFIRWKFFKIYKKRLIPSKAGVFYQLNDEAGLMDVDDRTNTGPFEFPDMIVTNQSIGRYFLKPNVHRVVNIGSGVGTFESQNAEKHPNIQFLASEMAETSTRWAMENRKYPNVRYCTDSIGDILKKEGKFDLAVSVDVIEHIADYKGFLDEFSQLADKAVISTPNRDRHVSLIHKPIYQFHVQEFNAGELFFILKMYYRKVELYSAPDIMKTDLVPVGIYSTYDKLFAYCEK